MTTPTGSDPNQGWSQGPPPAQPSGEPPPPPQQGYSPPTYQGEAQGYAAPYRAPGSAPPGGALAGFWPRFAGAFIDGILIVVITFVLALILGQFVGNLLGLVISAAYFVYFHSTKGQSLGQMVLNLKVVDEHSGGLIDAGRAAVRWLVASLGTIAYAFLPATIAFVISLAILVGYLWMLWDPKNQTWHDKAAKTLVIQT